MIKAKLILFLAMSIFGTVGLLRRYIPLASGSLAFTRGLLGAAILLAVMLIFKKEISAKSIRANLAALILSGILMAFDWIFLFEAFNHTTVAIATVCNYMAPVFFIIGSAIIFKERLSIKKIGCILAAFLGVVLVSGVTSSGYAELDLKGIGFGISAAICYASVILISKAMKDISAYNTVFMQLGIASAVLLPYAYFTDGMDFSMLDMHSILLLLFVGIVLTGLTYAMYFYALGELPTSVVAVFSYIDPLVAVLCSYFILKEQLGATELAGMILILGATLISELEFKKPVTAGE